MVCTIHDTMSYAIRCLYRADNMHALARISVTMCPKYTLLYINFEHISQIFLHSTENVFRFKISVKGFEIFSEILAVILALCDAYTAVRASA
jgi:hypothetical protein